ncbi:MAG: ergothioneine biosynthesis protein EgtB [Psychroflexus sp.]
MLQEFINTRHYSEQICEVLDVEDFMLQPAEHVSPVKWHLAHTTWFFEVFVLQKFAKNYQLYHPKYPFLFNSYYELKGERIERNHRGNLSRPQLSEIYSYRKYVTEAVVNLLKKQPSNEIRKRIEIGIHHEKQHQELIFTDIKFAFNENPLFPAYDENFNEDDEEDFLSEWIGFNEGVYDIGFDGDGFCYDNELGKHKVYLQDFKILNKLVTNSEFLEFMQDDAYKNPLLWHSEAWDWIQNNKIESPKYWHKIDGKWHEFKLNGLQKLNKNGILSHVSFYEAAAFAQWKNLRLPTEFEWEIAQSKFNWGKRWEWTESAYLPYPNYKKLSGALGEYNGKFMVNQKVLRGCAVTTSENHARKTYRNFFHPHLRWQFCGVRLAK